MTKEQILKKAIEKAVKNGWKTTISKTLSKSPNYWCHLLKFNSYFRVIFSHDFAKAFFGEELVYLDNDAVLKEDMDWHKAIPAYQYHLQAMVISEDPIKYLEKFL